MKERVLLAAMEAELARQRGSGSDGNAGSDGNDYPPDDYDGSAPPDDDIPF